MSHVPSWEIMRLDVFDKPAIREAMLGVKEETNMAMGERHLLTMLQ
jgi:hypothetical protein